MVRYYPADIVDYDLQPLHQGRAVLKKSKLLILILIVGTLVITGLVCTATGIIGYNLKVILEERWQQDNTAVAVIETQPEVTMEMVTPAPTLVSPIKPEASILDVLENEEIPINDPIDLVQRLEGKTDIPRKKPVEEVDRKVGDRETFWVTNVDTAKNFEIEALLAAETDHLYFWIEEGLEYSQRDLNKLVKEFEENIYPTNRAFFGSEWSPGVDNDPHLYVIYASGLGSNLAGYYASIDEYPPLVHEYSNAHETFMLNADNLDLGENYTYNVLAHEFQHMIHWYRDRNETSWLNEGFSELATLLNGYRSHLGGFDYLYARNPDLQLNDWPNDPSQTSPHYGSSFLFVTYFLDRFGNEATKALVSDDLNGLASVDKVLNELQIRDAESGLVFTADDVFMDWAVTNYLKDEYQLQDRFLYSNYPNAPRFDPTETIAQCPTGEENRNVSQFGVDYILLTCSGDFTLSFQGQQDVDLLPADPYSGRYAYWSNKGDQSNMTLTRAFDFRGVEAPLTLQYWTWYDLEEDYDYLYLEASLDGERWDILKTPSGTGEDPSGNSYGWAYNGQSDGDGSWIREEVDLSAYAGEQVQIRFEYVTDAAVHGEGFLLDDVSIPEIGYQTDFEDDQGGWEQAGFVRIENNLPQTYRLALVSLGDTPTVKYVELDDQNKLSLPLEIGGEGEPEQVLLIVSGTTRFTRQKADYQFHILP